MKIYRDESDSYVINLNGLPCEIIKENQKLLQKAIDDILLGGAI